jgi:DNA replication protein DnaC
MSTAITRNLMAELKLLGMSQAFDQAVIDATAHQWSCTEFFDVLLQAEADHRGLHKTRRLINAARLSRKACFEDFDYAAKRSITKAQVKELHSLHWLRQGRPLLLVGQTGVGKTFIAQAAGLQACLNGHSALFLTITEWLERLALARSSGSYLKFRDKLARPAVLIIDNFGMRKLTAVEAQDLCEIIEERSGQKSIVFTTQLPLKHWAEVIADPVIADAILDRLEHAALTLHITGDSYRGVKARQLATASQTD